MRDQGTRFGGRLNQDGSLDLTIAPAADQGYVPQRAIAVQSDGAVIVWDGSESQLYRREANGSIDTNFPPVCCQFWPQGAAQPDDKILLFDADTSTLVRLTASGKIDTSFNAPAIGNGQLFSPRIIFAFDKTGGIFCGGDFPPINGLTFPGVLRLSPTGELDAKFVPPLNPSIANAPDLGANPLVSSFLVQQDGKLIVAGRFSTATGENVARLEADGSIDMTFVRDPAPPDEASALAVLQGDGKVIIASRTLFGDRIIRLSGNGALDTSFTPVSGAVQQMAIAPDGKLLVAGGFAEINGKNWRTLARFNLHPPFKFASLTPTAKGERKLQLITEPGKTCIIEISQNLLDWMPLSTNSATAFTLDFQDPDTAKYPRRFYRARIR